MYRSNFNRVLSYLSSVLLLGILLNLGGLLHGCGEESTTPSDAEFEIGGQDINVCKNNFDCPNGYICENNVCVKYGGDMLTDVISDVSDISDVKDISDILDVEDVVDITDVSPDVEDAGDVEQPIQLTIYDIQDESSEKHPAEGTLVSIKGVVATSPMALISSSANLRGFFVEEKNGGAYSGILVVGYENVLPATFDFEIGDEFDITGIYKEFKGRDDTYSNSEIEIKEIVKTGNKVEVPAPVKIDDPSKIATGGVSSSMYQGVLVELNGVSVTKEADTYGEWTVDGNLRVDDLFYSYKPPVGIRFTRLVGILHTSFNNYKLEPRDENDIEVEIIDGGVDVIPDAIEDTGPVVKVVTIYDIQNTSSPNHPAENEAIKVVNVVVTAPTHSASTSLYGIFVEEKAGGEYSGILVVYPKNSSLGPFSIGDEITIEGSYKEYNGMTEIVATNITKTGSASLPDPVIVNPADIATNGILSENYEGVLVKVENVEVINANPDGPNNDYKEFMVTGNLRVNDLYQYDYTNQRKVGDRFEYIVGVLNFSFSNFKLEPRGNDDLKLITISPDAGEDVVADIAPDIMEDAAPDAGEDVVADAIEDASTQDIITDAGEDTGTQPSCDGIVKHIVISEVATRGNTAYDEFVELYNPLNVDIDLSGWKLQYKSSTGNTWSDRLVFPSNIIIKSHGYLLLAADTADYTGPTPDLKFPSTGMADNGHIRILNAQGIEIDKLGFYSTDPEGSPASIPCTTSPCTKSVERKARATSTEATMSSGGVDENSGNGYDTDNNANDFFVRQNRNPQNSQSAAENHGCFDCVPSGDEICDGMDNDCDGLTDAEDPTLRLDCEKQEGVCAGAKHTANQCVNGAWTRVCDATEYGPDYSTTEICDGKDNDCDGTTDPERTTGQCGTDGYSIFYKDADGDTFGTFDKKCLCSPSGLYTALQYGDCNDSDRFVYPNALEVCNYVDDDCDGQTDDPRPLNLCGTDGYSIFYMDRDRDTYGLDSNVLCLCSAGGDYTAVIGGDCDDTDDKVNPAATETCNGIDDNCDGNKDDENSAGCNPYYFDADGDTYYATGAASKCLCGPDPTNKYTGLNSGDCDDENAAIYPGNNEVADGLDNDCNGTTSESQYNATWGNIQWADKGTPSMSISINEDTGNIYGRVYVAGITDNNGDPNLIKAQLGIFAEDDISTIKWFDASHNPVCSGCGNNYEYMTSTNAQNFIVSGKNTYKYIFRYSTDDGANWIYGGYQDRSFKRLEEYDLQYAGTITLTGCVPSGDEVCDGNDNDCDGLTDAEDPTLKLDCEKQTGVCAGAKHTANQCVNGTWIRECDATEYGPDYSVNEKCDDKDNNCDGNTDEDFSSKGLACDGPDMDMCKEGVFVCTTDGSGLECNDNTGDNVEICNGLDDDCDGSVDEDFPTLGQTCDGADADMCKEGVLVCKADGSDVECNDNTGDDVEVCGNNIDDDCDGLTDEENAQGCSPYYYDADGDTYYGTGAASKCLCAPDISNKFTGLNPGDCNDSDPGVHPNAIEICNTKDDNCNSLTDEERTTGQCDMDGYKTYYKDVDSDTYGQTLDSKCLCSPTPIYNSLVGGDCNDADPRINPGALETCNDKDDNCDGNVDEENAQGCTTYYYDHDGDTYYMPGAPSKCLCSADGSIKYTGTYQYDCDDSNASINPAQTEVIGNNADDDCDGTSDENSTYTIGWCNTQHPYETYITEGSPTGNLYGRVYVAGLTDSSGDPNLIQAFVLIAPSDYTSPADFKVFPATHNASCSGCGNNYEYMANINWNDFAEAGKYRYVYMFAFSVDGGANLVFGLTGDTYYKTWTEIDKEKFGKIIATDHIVISEFMVGGIDHDDEFIEIYNPTTSAINIEGWKIRYSADGTAPNCNSTPAFVFPAGTVINPHGYILLAETGKTYASIADFTQTSISLSATGGHIFICNSSNEIVDKVGYGTASHPESAACAAPAYNKTMERKAKSTSTSETMGTGGVDEHAGNGYDSENNSQDFVLRDTPNPQNSSSPPEP